MTMSLPRISGRRNRPIDLDVTFMRDGTPTDPFAIRQIDIYHTAVRPENLLATFPFLEPNDPLYPLPAVRTDVGKFVLTWGVPADVSVPDVFFDVWSYFADNPCLHGGTGGESAGEVGTDSITGTPDVCDLDDPDVQGQIIQCCHRFWLYPDGWFCGDTLQTIDFGFEPLNQRFNQPEKRWLKIGLMPLPLYDFNFNELVPLIPYLRATISIETRNCEVLVKDDPMQIGLRSGSFRTNPYEFKYLLDTTKFLIGTYRYKIVLQLPDGTTKASPYFVLQVA